MANVINRTAPYPYLLYVNTPDYDPGTWLINPDLSGVAGVPQKYWKVVGDTVVQMTSGEQAAVDAALLAKTLRQQTFKVSTYTNGFLTLETFYDTDNGDGTYSNVAAQNTYTYSGSVLVSCTSVVYYYDSTVASTHTQTYFQNDQNQIITKNS